jgi:monothiol glutaredoxin
MIDEGTIFEFADVRTETERSMARIEGARLLDRAYHDHLLTLDRDTPIVFQCHHGVRSQAAAEYFEGLSFSTLYNLSGGIDAWSLAVDPSVPRY